MAVIDNFNPQRTGPDEVTITATVDGVEYTVKVWISHLTQLAAVQTGAVNKKQAIRQYIAQQLKAAADAAAPQPLPAGIDLTGAPITL